MDFPLRWIGVRVLQRRTDAHVQDTVSTHCLFRAVFPWNDSVSARQVWRLGLTDMDRVLIVDLLQHADQPLSRRASNTSRVTNLIAELQRDGNRGPCPEQNSPSRRRKGRH